MQAREWYMKDWIIYIKCSWCWEFKESPTNFNKCAKGLFWCTSLCKSCIKKHSHNRYLLKSDEIKEASKNYYSRTKNSMKYYYNNKDHVLEVCRVYRENHKAEKRLYYMKHREEISDLHRHDPEWREKRRIYEKEHYEQRQKRRKERDSEKWYTKIHTLTNKVIKKLWIRPNICPICWETAKIQAHHPDYNKRYEIIRACTKCHQRIHNWWFECPKDIVNLLR